MRLAKPRIAPLQDAEFTPEQIERLAKSREQGWLHPQHLPHAGALSGCLPRVLVVGRLCDGAQFAVCERPRDRDPARRLAVQVRHMSGRSIIASACNPASTEAEIERDQARRGRGWMDAVGEGAASRAVDDLNRDHFVPTPSWAELSKHYSERQCMDLVFTARPVHAGLDDPELVRHAARSKARRSILT